MARVCDAVLVSYKLTLFFGNSVSNKIHAAQKPLLNFRIIRPNLGDRRCESFYLQALPNLSFELSLGAKLMQKTILSSLIVLSLSACDSGVKLLTDDVDINTDVSLQGGDSATDTTGTDTGSATGTDTGSTTGTDTGSTTGTGSDSGTGNSSSDQQDGSSGSDDSSDGSYDDKDKDDAVDGDNSGDGSSSISCSVKDAPENCTDDSSDISDDAGSATSDGGQVSDDAGSATSDGGQVSDDAGSATSDGGQVSDDAGSATSDGGQVTDDSGSATSDGGQVNDDSGSATSDGGGNDDSSTDDQSTGTRVTDAGSFESDQIGGSIIRQSSLSAVGQQNVCTSLSARDDFSNIFVGDFILHNNAWRTFRAAPGFEWEQCIYSNTNGAVVGWNYDWGPGQTGINGSPNASGDFYVRSYPELIYGVKDEFRTSAPQSETGLPVRLGDMPNISIDYSYDGPQYGESRTVDASNNPRFPNGSTISGERNVAIESFFYNTDQNGQCSEGIVTRSGGSNHVYEVMVWLDAGAERLPAGPNDFVTNVEIRGEAFKVYTKGSDPRYIAFVAQNPRTTGTIYWNDFTEWSKIYAHRVQQEFGARSNSVQIQDDWCVANILVGTEIFWGAGNLDIFDWTITQRQP